MPKASARQPPDPADLPDIERHDEVYFRHASGPKVGRVLSRGAHGCVIEADGKPHKVHWENFLGHKVKVQPKVKVVDRGEDGFLVESPGGHRRFVRDEAGPADPPAMRKSLLPTVLLMGTQEALLKASGREIKNRPGLVLRPVTDKSGRQTKRWVRAQEDPPGKHNLGHEHPVRFKHAGGASEGKVAGTPGEHGVHVHDGEGQRHKVQYKDITHHAKPEPKAAGDDFKAADFARQHDDAAVTPEKILAQFDEGAREKVAAAGERVKGIVQTVDKYRQGDQYISERQSAHRKIYDHFLSSEKVERATPAAGEKPVFTILGGRGGSGKSKLAGRCYDPNTSIVIDPDEVKSMLPEYQGWNAHEVHEESGDVADEIISMARDMGLNVVLDGTLKTAKNALAKVQAFKADGYRIEAHYMHLPRQLAASRAINRFMTKKGDGSGRYVPLDKILENTTNEASFDEIRQHADAWSFHDNQVGKDDAPTLIAEGGDKKSTVDG